MVKEYVPSQGDIVSMQFNPQAGKEQAGRRPALVLSPKKYNEKVGLALFVPITSKVKGYPFEVILPDKCKTSGVILTDHIKSLDWRARKIQFVECIPPNSLKDVLEMDRLLLR